MNDPEEQRLLDAIQDAGVDGGMRTSSLIDDLERYQAAKRSMGELPVREINVEKLFVAPSITVRPITVLPLIWHDHSSANRSIHHARHDGREVFQAMKGAVSPTHSWVLQATNASLWVTTYHETLEAAQAAAQESWETFIRAAIQP